MTHFKQKTLNGKTYDLSHLDPLAFGVQHGNATYRLYVEFGCHCFTEETEDWHRPDRHYLHRSERRSFCTIRYDHSLRLPAIIRGLPEKTVYFAKEANYFVMRNSDLRGNGPPYVVFFDIAKMKNKRLGDVYMFIQSAYTKQNMVERASPVSFADLVMSSARKLPLVPGKSVVIKRE